MRAHKISLLNRAGHVDDGNFDSIDSKVSIGRLANDEVENVALSLSPWS